MGLKFVAASVAVEEVNQDSKVDLHFSSCHNRVTAVEADAIDESLGSCNEQEEDFAFLHEVRLNCHSDYTVAAVIGNPCVTAVVEMDCHLYSFAGNFLPDMLLQEDHLNRSQDTVDKAVEVGNLGRKAYFIAE